MKLTFKWKEICATKTNPVVTSVVLTLGTWSHAGKCLADLREDREK